MTHAKDLASHKKQKTISGDDLLGGISVFLKDHDLNAIFRKLLGIPETVVDEYFKDRYETKN